MRERRKRPAPISGAISSFLDASGLAERVHHAAVITDWAATVGPQIASVTKAQVVTADGTLFVSVKTNSWMTELTMLEPEVMRSLLARGHKGVKRIRWELMR